jgi:hypothetical protein
LLYLGVFPPHPLWQRDVPKVITTHPGQQKIMDNDFTAITFENGDFH